MITAGEQRIIECAERILSDEKHFFHHRGNFVLPSSVTLDGRCGVCYMGAAFKGCENDFVPDFYVDLSKAVAHLAAKFGVDRSFVHEIIFLNDTAKLTWQEISNAIRTGTVFSYRFKNDEKVNDEQQPIF